MVASNTDKGDVRVNWRHYAYATTQDGFWHPTQDIDSYVIERSKDSGPWTVVAERTLGERSSDWGVEEFAADAVNGWYIDNNAPPGNYRYRVRAVSSVGPGPWRESPGFSPAYLRTYMHPETDSDGNNGYCREDVFNASCYAGGFDLEAIGHMLERDFTIASTRYTINRLSHHPRDRGTLTFTLSRLLASHANRLILRVGTQVFDFQDATTGRGGLQYTWTGVSRPWTVDSYIGVRIESK